MTTAGAVTTLSGLRRVTREVTTGPDNTLWVSLESQNPGEGRSHV